jgi:hypothetical protein
LVLVGGVRCKRDVEIRGGKIQIHKPGERKEESGAGTKQGEIRLRSGP